MKKFNDFIKWFLYITTGILIVCAANLEIVGEDIISVKMLWQILASGFLTSLVTLLLFPGECNGRKAVFIKCFLHYAILCVVMIICGYWFGWMDLDCAGIIMMMVSVAVVYLLSFISYYIIDMKQAEEINKKLKEKYGDKE